MINNDFIVGQRWISNTEMQFGLGTVTQVEHRAVQIIFPAVGEVRVYAKASAPLTRVQFSVGDRIRSATGLSFKIESVSETNNILTYQGMDKNHQPIYLSEIDLDHTMRLSRPADRLLSGIIDKPKWFELRNLARTHLQHIAASNTYGLIGTRTNLIPHQLYIANEVAKRYAPRILLADEVGLGKTIEAGLIIHQQLLTERAERILIVVPETLTHQWLVEMLRRFNLFFSVYDEARCTAIIDSHEQTNPFHAQQLVLCSLSFLTENPARFEQALAGEWDMLVVDEAHHLEWTPQSTSIEYQYIERLSSCTKGVLLLTATPEQLGKAGHFARLRLLDPERFPDYKQFLEEEKHYEPIANAVENLLSQDDLDETSFNILFDTLDDHTSRKVLSKLNSKFKLTEGIKQQLIDALIDRHGTGRVLFRNTRHAIKGFPQRKLNTYNLPLPIEYVECLTLFQQSATLETQLLLCPELIYQSSKQDTQPAWTSIDPRLDWLAEKLKEFKPDKLLVITANAQSALDIAENLQTQHGIYAAVFHEGLSILERDRAAAFFANHDDGSQVLICSEIGSEGRNFQFAHHLVLFDLPLNPDLLEQRIGRLDRIGQNHTIQIHTPVLENSAQAIMHSWYHEGLYAFEHTCPAGQNVFNEIKVVLIEALHQVEEGITDLPALISTTQSLHKKYNQELQQGRDRLLEYSSFRADKANLIIDTAIKEARESDLSYFMDYIFDNFGIDSELHGQHSYIITPSDHIRINLPGLSEDGMTITYHRDTALANEDMQFLTWEHPLVITAIDNILSSETGNTAMVTIKHKSIKAGTLFVECLYTLESASTSHLNTARYLPPSTIRILVDHTGNEYGSNLTTEFISQIQQAIKPDTAVSIIKSHADLLKQVLRKNEVLAAEKIPAIIANAREHAMSAISIETDRLLSLKKINANIRDEELDYFTQLQENVLNRIDNSQLNLDAVKILIAT